MKLLTIMTSVFISIFTFNLNADSSASRNSMFIKNFRLVANGSTISPRHSVNFRAGTATVDYKLNTVKLELNVSPNCLDGLMCTTVLKKNSFPNNDNNAVAIRGEVSTAASGGWALRASTSAAETSIN